MKTFHIARPRDPWMPAGISRICRVSRTDLPRLVWMDIHWDEGVPVYYVRHNDQWNIFETEAETLAFCRCAL